MDGQLHKMDLQDLIQSENVDYVHGHYFYDRDVYPVHHLIILFWPAGRTALIRQGLYMRHERHMHLQIQQIHILPDKNIKMMKNLSNLPLMKYL